MARRFYGMLFVLVVCMLVVRPASALDPDTPFHAFVLDHWSVEQGLPQITVSGMAEDRAGFLWVITQIAVTRFDGERFVTFDRRNTGVDTSMLTSVWADPHGQVWFGGAHGLLRERDGSFTTLGGPAINAIIDAGDGTPLLATSQGLARVENDKIVTLAGYEGAAYSLLRDGKTLWIGGLGRICQRDVNSDAAAITCVQQDVPAQGRVPVAHLARAGGTLWLGTHAGLLRLDSKRIVDSGLSPELDISSIESLLTDRAGNLWVGTVQALYRRTPHAGLQRIDDEDISHHPWVQALFEDGAGNLWMGTHINGLYRIWDGWTRSISKSEGLADALVWSVARAPTGQLVIGTNSDVEMVEGERAHVIIPGGDLPNPSAYELYYDHRGQLWVGTRAGVAVYAGDRNVTPDALSVLSRWQINVIREVADDDVWIGTAGGLYRWHQGHLSRMDVGASGASSIIRAILPLTPDHLYLGTEDGVREWRDGKLTQPAWAKPLAGHFVSRLIMVEPDVLALATTDAGIGFMRDGRLRMTGQADGLPSDNAWTLDVLDGDLYVGSIAGVWRLPLATLPLPGTPVRRVTPQRLAGEDRDTSLRKAKCCNGGAGARSLVDGKVIWYATTDGALSVDTGALGAAPDSPPAVIESVEHDDHQVSQHVFVLAPGKRDLAINYTAPYLRIGTLAFRYQLVGYDKEWQDAGGRRTAFYTHLPPGDYQFRVAAELAGAEGFGPEADLVIRVEPFWYERALVRALATLLVCISVILLVVWFIRRQRRRHAWLETQVNQRTEQLTRAVERLRVANLALAEESQTDTLTALHNRRYLLSHLPAVLLSDERIGVLQIDIDHFKHINDRYGHAVGDTVLRELGRLLAEARRDSDITVRWGGEEFLLVLRNVDAAGVQRIAERLRCDVAARHFGDGRGGRIALTCSIGFSMHPLAAHADKATFDATVELADLALYRAKQDGRDTCVGLLVNQPLTGEILGEPLAPQLKNLLASGRLRWLRRGAV
ncbi:MAG: diguanylate cyclase [Rhodanobacter sp.]